MPTHRPMKRRCFLDAACFVFCAPPWSTESIAPGHCDQPIHSDGRAAKVLVNRQTSFEREPVAFEEAAGYVEIQPHDEIQPFSVLLRRIKGWVSVWIHCRIRTVDFAPRMPVK